MAPRHNLRSRIRRALLAWAMRQASQPLPPLRVRLRRIVIELAVAFSIFWLLHRLSIDARRFVYEQCAGFLIGLSTGYFFKRFIWRREVAGR